MNDVTQILSQIESGNAQAADQLLPLVYDELRRLAAAKLAHEKPGQTLQATALVHEAYLRVVDADPAQQWNSRGHFFAAAAEAMRRILVEQARKKASLKRGGGLKQIDLTALMPAVDEEDLDLIALDEALSRLERLSPEKAQIVKLRFFAELTLEQAAQAAGISRATAHRHWTFARAWLYGQLH